jgi:hypothetical protein
LPIACRFERLVRPVWDFKTLNPNVLEVPLLMTAAQDGLVTVIIDPLAVYVAFHRLLIDSEGGSEKVAVQEVVGELVLFVTVTVT